MIPSDIFTLKEGIITILFLVLLLGGSIAYRGVYLKDNPIGKLFLPALILKLVGGWALVVIHIYLIVGEDSLMYYQCITMLWKAIMESPDQFFAYMTVPPGDTMLPDHYGFSQFSTLPLVRIGTLFSLISGNSFWVLTFSFGLISFLGTWALYINLVRLFPHLYLQMGIILLFIPSVLVWGSGLMKDSITFGLFCWLCYAFLNLLLLRRKMVRSVLIIFFATILVTKIRVYMGVVLVPALLYLICHMVWQRLEENWQKAIFVGCVILGIVLIESAIDRKTEWLASYHYWHTHVMLAKEAGSGYALSPLKPGWVGMVSAFFPAVGTTFYRPFPWEWRNMGMIFMGLESLVLVLFTIWVLVKTPIRQMYDHITRNPLIGFFLIYGFAYAFVMGLFSYNFGTLARYRIAVLPFYLLAFLFIWKTQPPVVKKE